MCLFTLSYWQNSKSLMCYNSSLLLLEHPCFTYWVFWIYSPRLLSFPSWFPSLHIFPLCFEIFLIIWSSRPLIWISTMTTLYCDFFPESLSWDFFRHQQGYLAIVCFVLEFHKHLLFFILFLIYLFRPCFAACGILFPQPGIEHMSPALGEWSVNQWTTREVPKYSLFLF